MKELGSEQVRRALEGLPKGADALAVASRLRAELGPGLGARAAELHELRGRAGGKFARPDQVLLTRRGLEQASALPVARARAQRVRERAAVTPVVDGTAGLGADAMALAAAGLAVVAVERDPEVVRALAHNLGRGGGEGPALSHAIRADACALPVQPGFLLLDPDRRPPGARATRDERFSDPERWSPPLSRALEILGRAAGGALKLPPGLDPAAAGLDRRPGTSLQWVSLAGELKELVLWSGAAAQPDGAREVLALENGGARAEFAGRPERELPALSAEAAAAIPWIAEPDAALIRSGLLASVARAEGLIPLGPGLAYLGGPAPARSPLLTSWPVLGSAPLDRRRVRRLLASHGIGSLTVKKRGHPESAETLAHRFRGPGSARGLLLVARLEVGHRAFLLDRSGGR